MPSQAIDLTGEQFGRWTVLDRASNSARGDVRWRCRCQCGTTAAVLAHNLRRGRSTGCRNGACNPAYVHGAEGTLLYNVWRGMRDRCGLETSVNFHRYGERGISVAPEWDSFEAFRDWAQTNGWAAGKHLHRIDNDGDYTPDNCRFLTAAEHSSLHQRSR